jgi:hypothetical protein
MESSMTDVQRSAAPDSDFEAMASDGTIAIREIPIRTWQELQHFAALNDGWKDWLFRGQAQWDWGLETSLKRAADALSIDNLENKELGIIRRFKREYRQYSSVYPDEDDYIQWMSIMRHHGAPTRLLDITYSIYIGLYFAVIDSLRADAALWCFDIKWLSAAYDKIAPRRYHREYKADKRGKFLQLYKTVLNDRSPKVYRLNPYEMPARLTRQNGGFLVPMDLGRSFFGNLRVMKSYGGERPWIIKQKLSLEPEQLKEAFQNLSRMNITTATLFPGIDGFAQSLKMLITIPEATFSYTERFL